MLPDCVYIGLGGNQAGSRRAILAALDAVSGLCACRAASSLYLTEAQDYADQPPFLNAVAAFALPDLPALEFLRRLLAIEAGLGRVRAGAVPKGPRLIDLDLLLFGGAVSDLPELVLPHPRMARRRFVLAPLLEIAPAGLSDPRDGVPYAARLEALAGQAIYSTTPLKYTSPSV